MKLCPFCAEEIQDAAIVCKHCGRDLNVQTSGPAPPAPSTVSKKSGIGLAITVIFVCAALMIGGFVLLAVVAVFLGSAGGLSSSASSSSPVEYRVTGSASSASLTFTNESGGTEQHKVRLPWSRSLSPARGTHLYISAQNQGEFGTVIVEIVRGDTVLKHSESAGAYTIATASASR